MKYELQTIPVWKAYEAQPECTLCYLEKQSEERNQKFFLGNSIMAPEMRVKLNERGFCPRHFHMLAEGTGKLGYSLALKTHIESLADRLASYEKGVGKIKRGAPKAVAPLVEFLRSQERDCLMCERIRYNVLNYAYTIAKLFADEPEFAAALRESSGFCLHHLPLVIEMGAEVLAPADLAAWHEALFAVEHEQLARIGEDLEAFTWQFDYQSESKTPDHAQDAIPRAVRRISGYL
ncbi:MAG: DUF6062 family protein [Spirochaetales bacterium]